MARFRYRMQNILEVKEKLETQAKNEFAQANVALRTEEDKLEELKKRRKAYEERLHELYEGNLDLRDISETSTAIETIKYMEQVQMISVKNAEIQVERKREALSDAVKDVKTHEKLKEKQFEAFKASEAAKESKEIDELVSYRFGEA